MKGLKIFFLVLLGFLFISDARAKTDIQVNDGFEVVINAADFDLVAVDYTIIKTPVNYSNYLVINLRRDIIIKNNEITNLSNYSNLLITYDSKTIKAYLNPVKSVNNEAYSNPGKLNLSVNYNYTEKLSHNKRFKIPFGLRYRQLNHIII